MKVIGYIRVSTREQALDGYSLAAQRRGVGEEGEQGGWELVEVFEDAGFTGTTDDRPGLKGALAALKRRKAKALVAARLDRIARSVTHLGRFTDLSTRQGWGLVALDYDLNTTTANGK